MASAEKIEQGPLPERLVTGLSKIGLAMKSRTWRRQGRKGVGPLQVQVLRYLKTCQNQAATVSTIARELTVKLPTASEVIRTLAEKRLVRRRQEQPDQRIVMVHLTSLGAKAARVEDGWPELLAAATQQLSAEEQVGLLTALTKLIRVLQQKGEIPIARMCISCQHFAQNAYKSGNQLHHCRYFDVPFGDQAIRLDCPEYVEVLKTKARSA